MPRLSGGRGGGGGRDNVHTVVDSLLPSLGGRDNVQQLIPYPPLWGGRGGRYMYCMAGGERGTVHTIHYANVKRKKLF